MKPLRVFFILIIPAAITFAFGYFLIVGNSTRHYDTLLHGHPNLILTEDISEKTLITWMAAGQTRSGLILYDTVSHLGDPSKYAYTVRAARSDEIKALPGERNAGPAEKFMVELEGLNSLTTYYFVLKNNGEVSAEYQFITPPRHTD